MNAFTTPDHEIGRLGTQIAGLRINILNLESELSSVRAWIANPNPGTTPEELAGFEMRAATLDAQLDELRAGRAVTLAKLADLVETATATTPAGLVPSHLDPGFNEEDYAGMPALVGADYHGEVMAYESSSAEGPHLWIRVESGTGTVARVHLPADTGWKFAEQIITLIRNNPYGDATPAGAAYRVTPLFGRPDTGGPALPQDWADLLQALNLLAKHPAPGSGPIYAAHDQLTVCADETAFTADEIAQLDKLGFPVNREGGFTSTRFGNA